MKASQHGNVASSAPASRDGSRRQTGHAALADTANSGVTSPPRGESCGGPAADSGEEATCIGVMSASVPPQCGGVDMTL